MIGYKYSGGGDLNPLAERNTTNNGMKSRMFSSFSNNDVIMEEDEETFRAQKEEETPYTEDYYQPRTPNQLESRFDHNYTEEERTLNEEDLQAFAHIALQDQPLSIFD